MKGREECLTWNLRRVRFYRKMRLYVFIGVEAAYRLTKVDLDPPSPPFTVFPGGPLVFIVPWVVLRATVEDT